eukprot:tig00000841_g4738.t1
MGGGWIPAEGKLDLGWEGREEWPAAEIAAAGPENIRWLRLDGNRLTRIPGAELAKLTNLEKLWLQSNQLTALPPEIGRLSALQVLDVSFNQLTALPPEIGRLAALQTLYVGDNQLTALPPEIGRLAALQQLWVQQLESWPEPVRRAVNENRSDGKAHPPRPAPARAPPPPRPFNPRLPAAAAPSASPAAAPAPAVPAPAAAAKDPRGMRVADVCEWLRSLDLGRLAPAFEGCAVDGQVLLTLTDGDLREELGVESGLVRRNLLLKISDLAREHGLASAAPNAPRARPQSAAARRAPPLPPGYEFHAFITYRRSDKDKKNLLAALVREALDKIGYKVFYDLQSLQGGNFGPKILESLRRSCCDVFVLTPGTLDRCFEDKAPSAALSTDWVRKEVVMSLYLRKAIIPFVDDPNEKFPACDGLPADMAAFSSHNAVFFSNMYQQASFAKLCALIDAAVAAVPPYESLPPPLA